MRIPIAFKLIAITLLLLLAAIFPITYTSTEMFQNIAIDREKDSNLSYASSLATQVESLMINYVDKVKMIAPVVMAKPSEKNERMEDSFYTDRDLVSIEVLDTSLRSVGKRLVQSEYLKKYQLEESYIEELRKQQKLTGSFPFSKVFAEKIEVMNSSQKGKAPLLTIAVPLIKDEKLGKITHIAVSEIRLDRLQEAFSLPSEKLVFLVDKFGHALAHPKEEFVFSARDMSNLPIVKSLLTTNINKEQKEYKHPQTGEKLIGAYVKTTLGVNVIAQASEDVLLEAAQAVKMQSYRIAGRILSIALFLVFVFSMTLTRPIEKLGEFAKKVAKGDFEAKTNVKSNDEVGMLAKTFDEMVGGLQERDKFKNVLNKFHGDVIAEDLMKGDLALGGSRKEVTVFFSDIRDFTKFSEGHSPEQVVAMLNEYFEIMVSIINKYNGIVDKFIGDAIMAAWGIPEATQEDTTHAVLACLEMRQKLNDLNEKRQARGETPIKVGIGLHHGSVISGNIGSDERMEFTVIGDAVNTASRIEASTKSFGVDLLISDDIVERLTKKFMLVEAGRVEVKGKSKPLSLFQVDGYLDHNGAPIEIKTPWSHYEPADADKVKKVG